MSIFTTVRKFSPVGPCITLGYLERETERFYVYTPRGSLHGPRAGEPRTRRVAKRDTHIEPCRCCRDHEHTTYPDGYQD